MSFVLVYVWRFCGVNFSGEDIFSSGSKRTPQIEGRYGIFKAYVCRSKSPISLNPIAPK